MFDRFRIGILTCIFFKYFKFCVDFKYLVRSNTSMMQNELLREKNVTKIAQKVSKYTKKKLLSDRLRIGILTCIFVNLLQILCRFQIVILHTFMIEIELLRKNYVTEIS